MSITEEEKQNIQQQFELATEFVETGAKLSQAVYASKLEDRDALKKFLKENIKNFKKEYGTRINDKDTMGNTALHSFAGSKNMVDILIDKGADVNIKNAEGSTPIQIAACLKQLKIVKKLHYAGADIKTTDKKGDNVIAKLIKDHAPDANRDLSKIIKYFLQFGINLEQKNNEGKSAKDLANESPYRRSLNILLDKSTHRGHSR